MHMSVGCILTPQRTNLCHTLTISEYLTSSVPKLSRRKAIRLKRQPLKLLLMQNMLISFDENNWPDGCDVRDWYIQKSRPIANQS